MLKRLNNETIYGVEGVMTFNVEGTVVSIGPGESCFIPRGAVHGFNNLQSVDAKALAVVTPALIGPGFFMEMAAIVNAGGPPDMAKLNETIHKQNVGIGVVGPAAAVDPPNRSKSSRSKLRLRAIFRTCNSPDVVRARRTLDSYREAHLDCGAGFPLFSMHLHP